MDLMDGNDSGNGFQRRVGCVLRPAVPVGVFFPPLAGGENDDDRSQPTFRHSGRSPSRQWPRSYGQTNGT